MFGDRTTLPTGASMNSLRRASDSSTEGPRKVDWGSPYIKSLRSSYQHVHNTSDRSARECSQCRFILAKRLYGITPIVLTGYEYLITLDQEVTLFWRHKWTGATILFYATRYLGLLSFTILAAATYAPVSDKSCTPLAYVQACFSVSQYIAWAAFSALRTLALSNMNWTLASAVFILGLGPFAVNLWALSHGLTGVSIPPFGCGGVSHVAPNMSELSVIISRSCSICEDIIFIIVTWRSRLTKRIIGARGSTSPLGDVLIKNGTVYFVTILILNALHLTLTAISVFESVDNVSYLSSITEPLVVNLIVRFLVDLQAANQVSLSPDSTETPTGDDGGTLRFASRAIGSMGASLPSASEGSLVDASGHGEDREERPGTRRDIAGEGHAESGVEDGCDDMDVQSRLS